MVAYHASVQFRRQWFAALLKQDQAYYDVTNTGGVAGSVGPAATKYRRGLGRKFGEGVQFLTTGVGGLSFAFYSSWKVAFVVLAVVPFAAVLETAVDAAPPPTLIAPVPEPLMATVAAAAAEVTVPPRNAISAAFVPVTASALAAPVP